MFIDVAGSVDTSESANTLSFDLTNSHDGNNVSIVRLNSVPLDLRGRRFPCEEALESLQAIMHERDQPHCMLVSIGHGNNSYSERRRLPFIALLVSNSI